MWNKASIIGSFFLIALGAGAVMESTRLKVGTLLMPKPGLFPLLGGLLLIGLSVAFLIQGWLGRRRTPPQAQAVFGELRRPAILVFGLAIYAAVMEPLGYILPTFFLAGVILRVLGVRSWKALGLSSLILSAGSYVLFRRILGIDLPVGLLTFLE